MRNIKVIFSPADQELAEKLRCKSKKESDRYLALAFIFKIITCTILGVTAYLIICATVNKTSYDAISVIIGLVSATTLFLISFIFESTHYDYFVDTMHYLFIAEHMQEISKYENSLAFSISKTCSDTVTYDLPDGRCHSIETVNNIPADGDVIITIKEDADAKGQISLNWYAKIV